MSEISLPEFKVLDIHNQEQRLQDLGGKLWLVVNVASQCYFTKQYAQLEALYQKYQAQGLVVLGFPCNQFGNQEKGSNAQIAQFCELQKISFPIMSKVEVNGANAHPFFVWLRQQKTGLLNDAIKWNFTKFLVNPATGQVLERFAPVASMQKIERIIERII